MHEGVEIKLFITVFLALSVPAKGRLKQGRSRQTGMLVFMPIDRPRDSNVPELRMRAKRTNRGVGDTSKFY